MRADDSRQGPSLQAWRRLSGSITRAAIRGLAARPSMRGPARTGLRGPPVPRVGRARRDAVAPSPTPPRSPGTSRDVPTACAGCSCARAAGAPARSRRRPAFGPSRAGASSVRTGRPRRIRPRSSLASGLQAAQLPVLARFGGGDQRRPQPPVDQRVLPQHQLRPGDGVGHPGQRLVDQLALRVSPPRPADRPARDAGRRRRQRRVVTEQEAVPLEQALQPALRLDDLCFAGRRRRDSNPRRFRATVFKTVAFDHSATPPIFRTVGPSYPVRRISRPDAGLVADDHAVGRLAEHDAGRQAAGAPPAARSDPARARPGRGRPPGPRAGARPRDSARRASSGPPISMRSRMLRRW